MFDTPVKRRREKQPPRKSYASVQALPEASTSCADVNYRVSRCNNWCLRQLRSSLSGPAIGPK
jgi:hypothetical protein